jgi:hypothetical protein
MALENIETQEFKNIMQEHILKTIEYLFSVNQEFAIACEVADVHFDPTLPEDLQNSLNEITIFMIANYSFESATLEENHLFFEAGFGSENIGALVQIPLLSIKQIFINEYPILMNIASSSEIMEESTEEVDSMSALLNNPENAKLLKKKKK